MQRSAEYSALRGWLRVAKLFVVLFVSWAHGLVMRPQSLEQRSRWRQFWCRRVVSALGFDLRVYGRLPSSGLVVSNHLSYMDVLVLGALLPAVFVSKAEVRRWPFIGPITARGGTIYLNRESVRAAAEVNRAIAKALAADLPVLIFPEGTTTGGDELLPFHAALFEPAQRSQAAIWPVAISYSHASGNEAVGRIPYWGEDVFFAHLSRLMRLKNIRAQVRVAQEPVLAGNRTDAAAAGWSAVHNLLQHPEATKDLEVGCAVAGMQQTAFPQAAQH